VVQTPCDRASDEACATLSLSFGVIRRGNPGGRFGKNRIAQEELERLKWSATDLQARRKSDPQKSASLRDCGVRLR